MNLGDDKGEEKSALEQYGVDLTSNARDGKLDPVIGRDSKDAGLAQRFQPILVGEPSVQQTVSILRGLKERYEAHHGVRILDSALVAAANLSNRYLSERFLQDKAIDLIMTVQIELESLRKENDVANQERKEKLQESVSSKEQKVARLIDLWNEEKSEIDAIKNARSDLEKSRLAFENAQREGNYGKASELRYSTIPQLQTQLLREGSNSPGKNPYEETLRDSVSADDIEAVVSRQTGISVTKLMSGEIEKLVKMEGILRQSIRGQDETLTAVANAVRSQTAGLSGNNRPVASFLTLGPTGVGKTELSKKLASFLFSTESAMI
ncbi:MAG: chaperone ATPase hsp78 [Alectoria sarmentosa]|nr:MAG: chaperone ATPase hsp78 [Alectoria sarmentosa]